MRSEDLKEKYHLEKHPEGGWFSEVYTAPFEAEGRALAGSIYFLLDKDDISHFHRIDCDEVWYYHEGCGIKVTMIYEGKMSELLLGSGLSAEENMMVILPKGSVFAAENLDKKGYTFMSCMTAPKFSYEGFELLSKDQILSEYPELPKSKELLII